MIGRKKSNHVASCIAATLLLLASVAAGTTGIAQAALITQDEHWKYHVDRWLWDEDRRRTYGLTTPQIVIQNETADRLEGFIADANGTRLSIYDGQQVIHVRYMSNSGIASGWEMAGRVHDGYVVIDIPEKYRQAEIVKIYIGTNQYIVDDGTPTTPQTEVYFNSATLNYRTNSTLDQIGETLVAEVEEPLPVRSVYSSGSLIDWILRQNGMLPERSPDPGE